MKKIISILIICCLCTLTAFAGKPKKTIRTVVYRTNIECPHCAEKIRENIAFEKGVCDLKVDVKTKNVEVKFQEGKNDTLSLRKSINRLGYKAKAIRYE